MTNKTSPVRKTVRCAIYTRKSTEEGLDQEFNTLDAQRESGEAYVKSQASEGWECLPEQYDDGGFTGGNMERPALRRLMTDIEAGRVDCVVVYKVDRLSRSLLDFARMMEVFDRHRVAFVSVIRQASTTIGGAWGNGCWSAAGVGRSAWRSARSSRPGTSDHWLGRSCWK